MNKLIAKIKSLFGKKDSCSSDCKCNNTPAPAKCGCGNTKDSNGNCDGSHANVAPSTPPQAQA